MRVRDCQLAVDAWRPTSYVLLQHEMEPVLQSEEPPRRAGVAAARRGRAKRSAAENIIVVVRGVRARLVRLVRSMRS